MYLPVPFHLTEDDAWRCRYGDYKSASESNIQAITTGGMISYLQHGLLYFGSRKFRRDDQPENVLCASGAGGSEDVRLAVSYLNQYARMDKRCLAGMYWFVGSYTNSFDLPNSNMTPITGSVLIDAGVAVTNTQDFARNPRSCWGCSRY